MYLLTAALNVTVTKETCSSVNISWTSEDNRTTDFRILYRSAVHSGFVKYSTDASPPYSTKVTNLVADTEYNITVVAKYSDSSTINNTINARTKTGTSFDKGTVYWIYSVK